MATPRENQDEGLRYGEQIRSDVQTKGREIFFSENYKKQFCCIRPLANQLRDLDVNLSPPLEVNKNPSPSMKEAHIISLYIGISSSAFGLSELILIAALCLFSQPECIH